MSAAQPRKLNHNLAVVFVIEQTDARMCTHIGTKVRETVGV